MPQCSDTPIPDITVTKATTTTRDTRNIPRSTPVFPWMMAKKKKQSTVRVCLIRFYIGFVFGFLSNSALTPRKITCNIFGVEDDFHACANEKQTCSNRSKKQAPGRLLARENARSWLLDKQKHRRITPERKTRPRLPSSALPDVPVKMTERLWWSARALNDRCS